jgi:hypothetical protein
MTKIFSYYTPHKRLEKQEKIIELWKLSWRISGFEPVILGEKDAKSHPYYYTFLEKLKKYYKIVMGGKQLSEHGLSCYMRWLAYSTQKEENFFVSDYDVMSTGFSPLEKYNNIHLLDDCLPCFAYGNSNLFQNLCKGFIEQTEERLNFMLENKYYESFPNYNDVNFFVFNCNKQWNKKYKSFMQKYKIEKSRNLNMECKIITPEQKVIHFSKRYVKEYKNYNINHKPSEDEIIEVIEEVLEKYFKNY